MALLDTEAAMEVYDRWVALNQELKALEDQMKAIKKKRTYLEEEEFPRALGGFPGLMLPNGDVLRVNRKISSATPVASTKEELYDRFIADGDAGLLKNEVTTVFPVDQANEAAALAQELSSKYNVNKRRWIEPATLTKHIKTLLEQGKPIPEELLNIRYKTEVSVT